MDRHLRARHPGARILLTVIVTVAVLPPALSSEAHSRTGTPVVAEHRSAACNLCHFTGDASSAQAGIAQDSGCLFCHVQRPGGAARELGFHDGRSRSCAQCHSFHEPDVIRAPGGEMSRAALAEAGIGHCRSCHGAGGSLADLSTAHWAAARLYHSDVGELVGHSPSEGCLLCHGSDSESAWQRAFPEAATALERHSSHPVGVPNRATRAANAFLIRVDPDAGLQLPGGRIECLTCHRLPSRAKNLLAADGESGEICARCHLRNEPRAAVATAGISLP